MDAPFTPRELLVNIRVFYSQLVAKIEVFHIHIVTTIYGDSVSGSGRAWFYIVVLTMVMVIWRDLRKV